ncbi:MAG: McrB family protein, partial [bacterium]
FHDIDEKDKEKFYELKKYTSEKVELESKYGKNYSTVFIKDVINIYESNFLSFLNRKFIEYQKYYEEGINIREFKINFFDVLGDENSLGHYRKAYIILLLKGFFELTNKEGEVSFESMAEYFKAFYLDRKNKGFQVENNPDDRIGEIEKSSLDDIKYIIKSNPLNTKTLEDRLSLIDQNIVINKHLWLELSRDDIENIKYILNGQLSKYFNKRVDGDSMAIPDVERNKIEEALQYFDEQLRYTEEWNDFTSRKNHKYAIRYEDELYPVKKIISIATDAHISTFSGGEESNNYLKSRDFEIVELDKIKIEPLKSSYMKVLENYMDARKHEDFAGHELGDLVRHRIPGIINEYLSRFNKDVNQFEIKGSIGQGNWAKIPWIAIMDKSITTTTQEGIYIVYLYSKDMKRMYLTLMKGVTNATKDELINKREEIRNSLDLSPFNSDNNIDLNDSGRGKEYEMSTICYKEYQKEDIENDKVNEGIIVNDLKMMIDIYQEYKNKFIIDFSIDMEQDITARDLLVFINEHIYTKGFTYPPGLIENFYLSLKTKPFVLLAGISGTGKTKLIKLFAEAIGCNYKLISVRPDWSDSSDLLGYKNIQDKFQPGPIIDFIKEANDDPDNIYFVCLDEMNLARVEYYFSDFLSIMETREKKDNRIITDKLMTEKDFSNESDMQYADLTIPDNLYIIGTVNMDETTHPFSKKVLDRANTIEFSEINLDQYSLNDKVKETADPVRINNDYLKAEYITLNDCTEEEEDTIVKTIDKLEEINEILKEANLQVGYRVRDEVCFYMIYNEREELLEENIAFDFQLMQKILPRIQGSTEAIKKVLIDLFKLTANHDLSREDSLMKGDKAVNYVDTNQDDLIYPRSSEKIAYMIKRFEEDGFTAYWL